MSPKLSARVGSRILLPILAVLPFLSIATMRSWADRVAGHPDLQQRPVEPAPTSRLGIRLDDLDALVAEAVAGA